MQYIWLINENIAHNVFCRLAINVQGSLSKFITGEAVSQFLWFPKSACDSFYQKGCNISEGNSSTTKTNDKKVETSMKDLTKSGSNRHIPDSTKTLDVTIAAKRSFFRKKSKTILGPDAFNQTYFNRREDRNVLERCQSCESPPKRSKNIENQNRRKYFSSSKSLKLPDMPSESSAKSSLESVESAHEQSLHVAVDVHQQEPELKVASLASIDEILEFEQEMAQLEAGLVTLSTVHTLV